MGGQGKGAVAAFPTGIKNVKERGDRQGRRRMKVCYVAPGV